MRIKLQLLAFIVFVSSARGQECTTFLADTMTIPGTNKTIKGDFIETTLKNFSSVRLMKTDDGKIFIRLIVTENFYFNKVATLEIRSGSKSYWVKNAKQHKVDKTHGMFVTEIFQNYVGTLRDHGITGIEFGGAYTDYTRNDAAQVKEIARCMYASLTEQNHKKDE